MKRIYIHTNKINGKRYIGQTKDKYLCNRWGRAGRNYRYNNYFYGEIQEYGWDNFEHEVFEVCDSIADFMEVHFIHFYNTTNPKRGYNKDLGGNAHKFISEETKKKMSKAWDYNKHVTEETRRKQSEAERGEKHWNYGKHRSEETKKKISETKRLRFSQFEKYKDEGGNLTWREWSKLRREGNV